jgi:hypothetical protein
MRATEPIVAMPHTATIGTRPRKTQRQPNCSPTTAAAPGPTSDGTTHAVDMRANMRGRAPGGYSRPMAT